MALTLQEASETMTQSTATLANSPVFRPSIGAPPITWWANIFSANVIGLVFSDFTDSGIGSFLAFSWELRLEPGFDEEQDLVSICACDFARLVQAKSSKLFLLQAFGHCISECLGFRFPLMVTQRTGELEDDVD